MDIKRGRVVLYLFLCISLIFSACLVSTPVPQVAPQATLALPEATTEPAAIPTAEAAAPAAAATPAVTEVPFYQFVPGGQFVMGSLKTDTLAKEDEFPEHPVRLPGFWIFTNEVSNALYAKCVAAGKCTEPAKADTGPKSHFGDPAFKDYPVVGVTWNQADQFCKFYDAHLPTEAEWEKTARGFFANPFPWGQAQPDCNLENGSGCVKDTAKVGSYEAGISPFEVRDMAGNVREWVNDWYKADEYSVAPLFMPTGPETGKLKVVRGGSYLDSARDTRSAARFAYDPLREFEDVGFRCVPNGQTYAQFCSSSYRPSCRPTRPGNPPAQCNPGQVTGQNAKSKIILSCPDNGVGTVRVSTSETVPGVDVTVKGDLFACENGPGNQFECKGPLPAAGTPVTVEVCITNGSGAFEPGFGVHAVSCETYTLTASIGDSIQPILASGNPYFTSDAAFIIQQMQVNNNCPTGYSWDPKLGQCVRNPGTPGEVPPGTENRCPIGYVLDVNLGCCVLGTPDNGGCQPGYYLTAAAPLCVPIQENGCPAGFTYDPYLGCIQMVHQGDQVANGCPPGTHLSTDGKTCELDNPGYITGLTCPPGSFYVQGQGCVESTVGTPPMQCPDNSYYDYNLKTCVGYTQDHCPPGTYMNPDLKQCLPLTGPWTGCAPNMMINPRNGCCVPIPGTDNSDCIGYPDGQIAQVDPEHPIASLHYDPAQSDCPPPNDMVCGPGYHLNIDQTMCLPNSTCPPGTGPTPNNPNGCFPQGTEPCPQGFEMSNSGLGCVPTMADGMVYQCSPSQYFDPYLGMCLDRTDDCCAQGYFYNQDQKLCIPILQNGNYCPPGWVWDGAEGCTPAMDSGPNCTSFNMTVPACQITCPKGYEWNANKQACVKINTCPYPGAGVCKNINVSNPGSKSACLRACCNWRPGTTTPGTCY